MRPVLPQASTTAKHAPAKHAPLAEENSNSGWDTDDADDADDGHAAEGAQEDNRYVPPGGGANSPGEPVRRAAGPAGAAKGSAARPAVVDSVGTGARPALERGESAQRGDGGVVGTGASGSASRAAAASVGRDEALQMLKDEIRCVGRAV